MACNPYQRHLEDSSVGVSASTNKIAAQCVYLAGCMHSMATHTYILACTSHHTHTHTHTQHSYGGTSQLSELGQCSVVTMLTGWVPEIHATRYPGLIHSPGLSVTLSPPFRGAWGLLCGLLPLWKRPAQDGDSDQPDHESNTILMASSMAPHCFASRSLPEPHEMVS